MALQADLGAVVHQQQAAAQATVVLRYLQTAGFYLSFMDDLRTGTRPTSLSTAAGIEIRPLFLPRFLKNLEQGPSFLDLTLDSIGLRAGAILSSRPYAEPKKPAFELLLTMGAPLGSTAKGLWLGLSTGIRIDDSNQDTASRELKDIMVIGLSLGWQSFFDIGVVDAADRPLR